jgi:chromate reductase, NAD(P)H dehydrogenase (quinone)
MTMRLLGISGSLRADSHNTRLLEAAALGLPSTATLEIFEGLEAIPPFSEDDQATDAVLALREAIDKADAVLIATPEYNHSIPGQLKNALDWASRPYRTCSAQNKPVAVIGASTGLFGAVWAQAELRKVLGAMGARVVDRELPVGQAHQAFGPDGRLAEPELQAALDDLVQALLHEARVGAEVTA